MVTRFASAVRIRTDDCASTQPVPTPIGGTPDGIKAFIKDETERWGDVIRAAKITAD